MQRMTFARMGAALLVAAALALAGCGGDDGVDQSVHDMALAELDEAASERDAAEMALAAAMAAAEAAAAEADLALAAAQQAQADAVTAAEAAEAARDEARMGEADAEMRASAAERAAAEAAAKAAEAAQDAQDAADQLAQAQADLADAMMAQEMAEGERDSAQDTAADLAADAMVAEVTARAESIADSMGRFIADDSVNNAERAPGVEANVGLGITATNRDYLPGDVSADVRFDNLAITTVTDRFLDTTLYGDEAVARDPAADLEADISVAELIRPSGAPSGASVKYSAADGVSASASAKGTVVVGYEEQDAEPPAIDGWDGGTLLRRDDDNRADQILYYYTDIAAEAAGPSFLVKYQGTSFGVDNDNLGMAKSLTFPSASNPSVPLIGARDADTTTDPATVAIDAANHFPFAGTFDGVAGTFKCVGLCTANYNAANGSISFAFGADGSVGADGAATVSAPNAANFLTFTPDNPNDSTTAVGGDHLVFGYWLHKPDDASGTHEFMAFATGLDAFDVRGNNPATDDVERDDAARGDDPATTDVDERFQEVSLVHRLTGTARFKGPAAGKYITRDVLAETAQIGQFTATAELLANFDGGTPIDSQPAGIVNGVVRDFMDANGDALSGWNLTLDGADLEYIGARPGINEGANRDPAFIADDTFNDKTEDGESTTQFNSTTTLSIGDASADGRWVAEFRGNGRADGNPKAITGVFDADGEYVTLSGAFGAYNTKAE